MSLDYRWRICKEQLKIRYCLPTPPDSICPHSVADLDGDGDSFYRFNYV